MSIKIDLTVRAPVEQVYAAFTNSTALREWLCDLATTELKIGGRIYMWWASGFYVSGEFTSLIPNQFVEFSWNGRGEPGPTCVQVSILEEDHTVKVELVHSGLGEGPEWEDYRQEFQLEWERSLRNLVSVLETGADLRITRRPMLGIYLSDFNAEIATAQGVPVSEGVRIEDTLDGMGAQKAGLQKNDVIVGMDAHPVRGYSDIPLVIQKHEAGDKLNVEYYRGPEKHSVEMELGRRPIPDIIWDPNQLADFVSAQVAQADAALEEVFRGISEEQASRRLSENDWSAKEVLAHLILTEQGNSQGLASIMEGAQISSDGGGNNDAQTRAVVAVYKTIPAMLQELKNCEAVTLEMIRYCGAVFVARKGSYWRVAFNLLQGQPHIHQHIEQIKTALQA